MLLKILEVVNKLSFGFLPNVLLSIDISIRVKHGEKIAIIGRNGSGKSTLLNLIQGALAPTITGKGRTIQAIILS